MYCLVDHDNVIRDCVRSSPRGRTQRDYEHALDLAITAALSSTRGKITRELQVRLYSGWVDEDGVQTHESEMASRAARQYPKVVDRRRIKIALAHSLLSHSDYLFAGTVREREMPTLRHCFDPRQCAIQPTCALPDLHHWLAGRCPRHPSCNKQLADVVISRQQKLIDTMIVADAFTAALDLEEPCVVVSNDDDMIPGILALSTIAPARSALIRISRRRPSPYDQELVRRGVLEDL
jgi:hypothetical protein